MQNTLDEFRCRNFQQSLFRIYVKYPHKLHSNARVILKSLKLAETHPFVIAMNTNAFTEIH